MHSGGASERAEKGPIRVYGIPGSPFLRAVEVTLREKGADYRLEPMSPTDMRTPGHLAMHPFGRIPIFKDGEFCLYETQAIVRYIDEIFPEPSLVPSPPRKRARMNQLIGVTECYLFPKVTSPIGFNRIIGPRLLGIAPDEAAVQAAMPVAQAVFGELDRLIGDQPYFGGETVSLGDIMLASQLDLFSTCSEGATLIGDTRLESWLERMCQRPSFASTEPPAMLRRAA